LISDKLKTYEKVYLIDVGYHKGHFVSEFLNVYGIERSKAYVVGIDPIDHREWKEIHQMNDFDDYCDDFHQVAISTIPGKAKFNIYDEPGCNSLHEMNIDKRVDKLNSEDGWYCGYEIKKIKEIEVIVTTLKSIIEMTNQKIIHFLKVDTQGNDINVIKSCEERIHDIMFIQMESCVAKNKNQIMYENQTTIDYDIEFMKSLDFEVLNIADHSGGAPPEANILLYNKRFI
jgi:FkbM family methyltransferase